MKLTLLFMLTTLLCTNCEKQRKLGPPKATAIAINGQMQLHLMTFNIRHESKSDRGPRAWNQRIVDCIQMIRSEDPDIFGIQEALHGQVADIWASLPDYEWIGLGRTDGLRRGEYTGLFFRRDRFELQQNAFFWLSDTPKIPGSMSWGNQCPRVVCWAYLADRSTGREFYVYNTHWDHRNQRSRELSALMITDHIDHRRNTTAPVVLLGDFNATEGNRAMRVLTGSTSHIKGESHQWKNGLTDTFTTLHPNEDARTTLHFWSGRRTGLLKVDHILVSPPVKIVDATIRDQDQPMVSDHFPVTATVVFPPPEEEP